MQPTAEINAALLITLICVFAILCPEAGARSIQMHFGVGNNASNLVNQPIKQSSNLPSPLRRQLRFQNNK